MKPFESSLSEILEEYVRYRQGLGYTDESLRRKLYIKEQLISNKLK